MNIAREDHNQPEAHDMSHKKGLDSELAFAEKHHAISRNRYRSTPLEDYALLSDLQTGPLVSRDGSVDWLCLPRFDSPSVFAALLGTPDDGRWKLLIRNGVVVSRSYIPDTFILETVWETPTGKARVLDYLPPSTVQAEEAFEVTKEFWQHWIGNLDVGDTRSELVRRSLLVLRALTHSDTGGIVAAPTASLPEDFGGERNWDYRYTWLRDAALTVEVMVAHGFVEGATNWRDWLLRAVAGDVENLQIMYGLGGKRELEELELDHLAGYENSRPVRIGNGAAGQYQADVVGEVMLALAKLRDAGYPEDEFSWGLQKKLLDYTITNIHQKDHGIWEMRGDLHYFTHGRVMMWAAFNEGIRAVEEYGLDGDAEVWRYHRDSLRDELLLRGYNEELGSFTQSYENTHVDASLLQIPHTGFLAADDPRMLGTVAQIEKQLVDSNGLVYRYLTDDGIDGLAGHEYPFLICTFWLIEQYAMSGRIQEAQERLDSVVAYANDLGLLSEEYDPQAQRLAGNFPQAFSHLGLIRAVDAIERYKKGSADQD
ncbi:glycoside hydrolase family 15 protein [Corynebacterium pseudotuberculosis]|uniref:glycoside hydrolase family 15 protein n=1 Tax=Corynebacterium pseudotuberculosis TaxID=1719 RepID=UPI0034E940C6